MFVVMGATGHIGSVIVADLLARKDAVLALIHSPEKAANLESKGAKTFVVDARNPDALRVAFKRGRRAFLLNPPAAPSTDTDAEETATVRAILEALDGSGLEKVVAASTMGASAGPALQPRTGDSSVLYEFEQGLTSQPIPAAITAVPITCRTSRCRLIRCARPANFKQCSPRISGCRWWRPKISAKSPFAA